MPWITDSQLTGQSQGVDDRRVNHPWTNPREIKRRQDLVAQAEEALAEAIRLAGRDPLFLQTLEPDLQDLEKAFAALEALALDQVEAFTGTRDIQQAQLRLLQKQLAVLEATQRYFQEFLAMFEPHQDVFTVDTDAVEGYALQQITLLEEIADNTLMYNLPTLPTQMPTAPDQPSMAVLKQKFAPAD